MKPWFVLLFCMVWMGHCDEQTETLANSDSSTSTEENTAAEDTENDSSSPADADRPEISEPAEPVSEEDNSDQGNDGDPEESTTDSNNPDSETDERTENTEEAPVAESDEESVDTAPEEHGPSPPESNVEVDSSTANHDESSLDGDNNDPEETSQEKPNPDLAADVPSESDTNSPDKSEPAEPVHVEENTDQGNDGDPEESTTDSNNPDSETEERTENTEEAPVAENDKESVDTAPKEQGPSLPENNVEVDSSTPSHDESSLDGDNNGPEETSSEKPNPGLVDNVPSESDANKTEKTAPWKAYETPVSGDNPDTHNPFPPRPGNYKPPKPPGRAPPGTRSDGEESETENDHHIPNPRKQERPTGDGPRNTNSDGNQKEASRHFPPRRNYDTEMTDGRGQTSDLKQPNTASNQTETSKNNSKPVRHYTTPPQLEEKRCAILRRIRQLKLDDHVGIKAASWMCFFKHVSNFNTSLTRRSRKGRDYGISQFNNQQHCKDGDLPSKNMCNTDCHKFLDHNLADDFDCLKTIVKNATSLTFWSGWNKHCKGKVHHHYVAGCQP
ncbi:dentin sialophosphoprotein-like [Hyperolius riggenbachi]|uniref:dentin sialophosphoprotein-like n=1 Tax=Hyperolius riggenbachi TaxID=752182 RepID=UPI0035A39DE1